MGHIFTLLSERLGELPEPEKPLDLGGTLLHESCFISRQIHALDDVQEILAQISTTPPKKMAYQNEESACCGGRLHYRMLDPEASKDAAKTILNSLDRNANQDRILTTSSMCQHALNEAGPDQMVTSLLEFLCDAYDCK
jgi:Fe-S oxidoreductase